ncbi:MAG: hypothetical protein R8M38_00200 [Mariprofundaceae bacterium]
MNKKVAMIAVVAAIMIGGCGNSGGSSTLSEAPPASSPSATLTRDWSFLLGNHMSGNSIRPLLGVNVGPYPAVEGNADITSLYQQIGVNMVRTHDFYGPMDMADIYPDRSKDPHDPASYHFSESDIRFAAIVNGGFEAYLRIGDSWNNVTPPTPSELANWVVAAEQVVAHYHQGLWGGFFHDFRYVEIWNEPDGGQFWPAPNTFAAFIQLFGDTAIALKAAFPSLQIGGPGFAPGAVLSPAGREKVADLLDAVVAQDVPLGFLSWHLYSNVPEAYTDAAAYYRSELDSRGLVAAESHITEWNTGINQGNPSESEKEALRMGGKGASILTGAWIALQYANVDVSTFYRGNDTAQALPTFHGLFMADGTPKKIADAFSLWSTLVQYPDRVELSQQQNSPNLLALPQLWVLAGLNSSGDLALLVANPNAEQSSYALHLGEALGDLVGRTVMIQEVHDNVSGIQTRSDVADKEYGVTIEGYAVQMLIIKG